MSSSNRKPLQPQREAGRQRVAELLNAAAAIFQERGYESATMAEIAARADARIGSLYRFFPNKDAIAEALIEHYSGLLQVKYDAMSVRAATSTPEELAENLIDLLVTLYPQTKAVTALLDARAGRTDLRARFRSQTLAGIKAALKACAPGLDDDEADGIATVVLNNMKTMAGMSLNDAPTSLGASQELRLMNRLYLAARLSPARSLA